jgi:Na+-transporting NADH:ubiquinone oxidoreductase subunit C
MKDRIMMIVFVLVLGSVWTTTLVVVDKYTKPIIRKHQEEKLRRSVLGALGIDFEGKDIDRVYTESVSLISKNGRTVYRSTSGDVAFAIAGPGSQGPISGVLALMPDLETIKGITIVSQVETPGLGERVLRKNTLDGFIGKKLVPRISILTAKTAHRDNEVQGISGATLTCKAFETLINTNAEEYISLLNEGR